MFEITFLRKKKQGLERKISAQENLSNELDNKIKLLKEIANNEQTKADNAEIAAKEAQSVLDALNGKIHVIEEIQDYNIPYYQDSLDELEHKRYELQSKIESAVNTGLYRIEQNYTLNGSDRRGKEMQDVYGRGLIYSCNAYIDNKEKSVTTGNIAKSKELIKNKFNSYQSKANKVGLALNAEYVKARLDMLDINLAIKVKQKEEKARIREEKRRLREQEQLLAEAEREQQRLEEERKNLQKLFAQAVTREEQDKIKEKLSNVDKRIENIDWRVSHANAGWLYIATTQSMPGIYKAGCTRRLNPLTRLSELSSASVPFVFECRWLVFSESVFELEAQLHKRLDKYRVNKDNTRKEFFYGEPVDAINILRNEFNVDVHFVDEDCDENEEDE